MLILLFLLLSTFTAHAIDSLDEAITQGRTYEYGQPSAPLDYITEEVLKVQTLPETRDALSEKLANELTSEASFTWKQFICRQLLIIAGTNQVDNLTPWLLDEKMSDMARYVVEAIAIEEISAVDMMDFSESDADSKENYEALEKYLQDRNIYGDAAILALRNALGKSSGLIQAGIINSLSLAQDLDSVPAIVPLLDSENSEVVSAAIKALGHLGGGEAKAALIAKNKKSDGNIKRQAQDALLSFDEFDLELNHPIWNDHDPEYKEFVETFESFLSVGNDISIRRRALMVLGTRDSYYLKKNDGKHLQRIEKILSTANDPLWRDALGCLWVYENQDSEKLAALVHAVDVEHRPYLITALSEQLKTKALPAIQESLSSPELSVRLAAIAAIGKLGNKDSLAPLLDIIANDSAPEAQAAAREALYTLAGDDINAALLSLASNSTPETQLELVKAIGARRMNEAMTLLQDYAKTQSGELQEEAYKALGDIATREDIPALLDMLKDATADARKEIESALVSALRHAESAEDRLAPLLDYLKTDVQPEIESTLYDVLGKIGDAKGLDALREGSHEAMESVRDAAISALANWPDDATIDDLWTLANSSNDKARDTAMSGYVRLLRMSEDMSDEDALARYKEVMQLAQSDEVKKAVLAGLGELKSKEALDYVESFSQDEALKREAKAAADQIRVKFYTATSSDMDADAHKAVDGDMDTRWSSGIPMKPGIWFMLDLGNEATVSAITLDGSRSGSDFPRGYEIYLSNDKDNFGDAVAKDTNDRAILRVNFPATKCRYIKIVQTGESTGNFWSIHELRVDTE